MSAEEIARGLSEDEKRMILDWSNYQIGRWLLWRMAIFPARRQGRTILGAAFRAILERETDHE